MNIILTLLPLLLLCACTTHRSELARSATPNLNRQALIKCLGMPSLREENGDQESLIYSSTVTDAICPLKAIAGVEPPVHHCQAEFVLEGDKVRSINYRQQDDDLSQSNSQCAFILENCGK